MFRRYTGTDVSKPYANLRGVWTRIHPTDQTYRDVVEDVPFMVERLGWKDGHYADPFWSALSDEDKDVLFRAFCDSLKYDTPVTVGGWYETTEGRWTEFAWVDGKPRVVGWRAGLSRGERDRLISADEHWARVNP